VPTASPKQTGKPCRHDENFARYYADVGRTKILDAATERKLFQLYKRKKDLAARDKIIGSCLRFVVKLAHRYSNDVDQLKDLISAGNIGLLVALDRYDPKYKTRFLSYATYWVLLHIRNELHAADLIAMPLWRQKQLRKVRRVRASSSAQNGEDPSEEQICDELDITPAQLRKLQVESFHYVPVEHAGLSNNGTEARTMNAEAAVLLRQVLGALAVKEQFVLRAYFGLASDPMSLQQIAKVLGVTSERVRQVKVEALKQLKRSFHQLDVESAEHVCAAH